MNSTVIHAPYQDHKNSIIFGLILLKAFTLRVYNLSIVSPALNYDEGVHIAASSLTASGYIPYRDFFFAHPPLILYILGSIFAVAGPNVVLARFFSISISLITLVLVYFTARQLVDKKIGLLAALFFAIDVTAVTFSRMILLESLMSAFTLGSILSFLYAVKNDRNWGFALSGTLAALAVFSKLPALLVLPALFLYLLLSRKFRPLIVFCATFMLISIAIAIPFLMNSPEEFIKQVFFFQLLRPAQGSLSVGLVISRGLDFWRWDFLIIVLGFFGAIAAFFGSLFGKIKNSGLWMLLFFIFLPIILFILFFKAYDIHFKYQLTPFLSIFSAFFVMKLLHFRPNVRIIKKAQKPIVFATLVLMFFTIQYPSLVSNLNYSRPNYFEVEDLIIEHIPSGSKVLLFTPYYVHRSSHEVSGMMIDSYGLLLYSGLHLDEAGLADATKWLFASPTIERDFWSVMHDAHAQALILRLFEDSDYIILDWQASWELSPQTQDAVRLNSTPIASSYGVEILQRSAK